MKGRVILKEKEKVKKTTFAIRSLIVKREDKGKKTYSCETKKEIEKSMFEWIDLTIKTKWIERKKAHIDIILTKRMVFIHELISESFTLYYILP